MSNTIWCAETASKAYIDAVNSINRCSFQESNAAELLSAMAAGSKAQLIVEAWARGGDSATSLGLIIASRHACGRHVCVVPDERSRLEYENAMSRAGISPDVVVGEAEEVMGALAAVDFVVVDSRRRDFAKVLTLAKISPKGAVLVCQNANPTSIPGFRWRGVLRSGTRVLRSAFLPVGKGLEIAEVCMGAGAGNRNRWIRQIDRQTGEDHVFRI